MFKQVTNAHGGKKKGSQKATRDMFESPEYIKEMIVRKQQQIYLNVIAERLEKNINMKKIY